MQISKRVLLTLVSAFSMMLLIFALLLQSPNTGLLKSSVPNDAAEIVAREFGVPRERVVALAQIQGIDPDRIGEYGDEPFPLNYYLYLIKKYQTKYGKMPTRSWITATIKGYIAECTTTKYSVAYLYYTDRVHLQWFSNEIAYAIMFYYDYENPDLVDQEYFTAGYTNLRDGSVNPPDNIFWDTCIQTYRNNKK